MPDAEVGGSNADCGPTDLFATEIFQYLQSPGYPDTNHLLDGFQLFCEWSIEPLKFNGSGLAAISIHITDIDVYEDKILICLSLNAFSTFFGYIQVLAGPAASLSIYQSRDDGLHELIWWSDNAYYYGYHIVTSSGRTVKVRFKSDGSQTSVGRGFSLSFQQAPYGFGKVVLKPRCPMLQHYISTIVISLTSAKISVPTFIDSWLDIAEGSTEIWIAYHKLNMPFAKKLCHSLGAILLEPRDEDVFEEVLAKAATLNVVSVWIGVTDAYWEGRYLCAFVVPSLCTL